MICFTIIHVRRIRLAKLAEICFNVVYAKHLFDVVPALLLHALPCDDTCSGRTMQRRSGHQG